VTSTASEVRVSIYYIVDFSRTRTVTQMVAVYPAPAISLVELKLMNTNIHGKPASMTTAMVSISVEVLLFLTSGW